MKIYQFKGKCNISGSAIRRERERQRLSQEQLAARMQVEGIQLNQKAISRIETGGRVVADYELTTFSRVLGVSMQKLVDQGHRLFIELGPGKTLAGMMGRICKDATVISIEDVPRLEAAVAELGK